MAKDRNHGTISATNCTIRALDIMEHHFLFCSPSVLSHMQNEPCLIAITLANCIEILARLARYARFGTLSIIHIDTYLPLGEYISELSILIELDDFFCCCCYCSCKISNEYSYVAEILTRKIWKSADLHTNILVRHNVDRNQAFWFTVIAIKFKHNWHFAMYNIHYNNNNRNHKLVPRVQLVSFDHFFLLFIEIIYSNEEITSTHAVSVTKSWKKSICWRKKWNNVCTVYRRSMACDFSARQTWKCAYERNLNGKKIRNAPPHINGIHQTYYYAFYAVMLAHANSNWSRSKRMREKFKNNVCWKKIFMIA